MTKKAKKLGVKISSKSASSGTSSETNNVEENNEIVEDSVEATKENLTEEIKTEEIKEKLIVDDSAKSSELPKICRLLDKLTLEMLVLMEQQIQQKLKIETGMTDGEANLAKSRYILGLKNVSALQLPSENSFDIAPSVTIEEIQGDDAYFGKPCLTLNIENFTKTPTGENEEKKNIQDPIHWFGVLVPRNLHMAQASFKGCLDWVVECANTQTRLHQICIKIQQLRDLKNKLSKV